MIKEEVRATVYTLDMHMRFRILPESWEKQRIFISRSIQGWNGSDFRQQRRAQISSGRLKKLPNVCLEGMFTHFAKADELDKTFSEEQYRKFVWMRNEVEKRGISISQYHCDNSAGIIDFPQWKQNLVRAGIALYGLYPSEEVKKETVDLKPALRLVSHVSFVKEVEPGASISTEGLLRQIRK